LADGIGKLLAVPDRAVKVDRHDGKARPGIDFRIPAVVELVEPAALRAAVHEKSHGVFLAGLVTDRLHDITVDRIAIPALEGEPLVIAEGNVAEPLGVEV